MSVMTGDMVGVTMGKGDERSINDVDREGKVDDRNASRTELQSGHVYGNRTGVRRGSGVKHVIEDCGQ